MDILIPDTWLAVHPLVAAVAFCAGCIRGFTGFGGPAFILAVLTWLYNPFDVIGNILIIEFVSASYLMSGIRRKIVWPITLAVGVPTLITMPVGYWVLEHIDPLVASKFIAAITFLSCVLMSLGLRYSRPLNLLGSVALGLVGGVIFGASYIALPVVAVILMGPTDNTDSRTLLISWGYLITIWFIIISVLSGDTTWMDVKNAVPMGIAYFSGTWIGSRFFGNTSEGTYRKIALLTLMLLSIIGLIK